MHISRQTFRDFVVPPTDLPYWRYHGAVSKYYCGLMEVQSACPNDCTKCKDTLQDIFAGLQDDLDRPMRLVIWRSRRAVAIAQETNSVEEKIEYIPRTNIWGIPTSERNPFLKFIK